MNEILVRSDLNGVRTLRFNIPSKLNGWSPVLMAEMLSALKEAGEDPAVNAVILTGTGRYYCAGVDFAGSIKPMHPRTLKASIVVSNQALFDGFLDFPKPLFAAVNGPAIGAAVTSATLCDMIFASESATFLTPFKGLGLVPEGCSSYNFPRMFGDDLAKQVLEGLKLDAHKAKELGMVDHVVTDSALQSTAQNAAEEWIRIGRNRKMTDEIRSKLKEVNAGESVALANAILDYPFLDHMCEFTYAKSNYAPYAIFWVARATRPLWSKL